MKIRYLGLFVGAAALICAGPSTFAQALPSLGGGASANASASPDASAAQDQLVKAYVAADSQTLLGQGKLAEALGLKDQAAEAAAEAAALQSAATNSSDPLSKANEVENKTGDAVSQELSKNATLSADSTAKFSEGLGHLGSGLLGTIKLKDAAVNFQKSAEAQISSASILQKMSVTKKLSAGMYVAKNLPGHITSLSSGLKNAISFAQSHKIPVPDDATKALTALVQ